MRGRRRREAAAAREAAAQVAADVAAGRHVQVIERLDAISRQQVDLAAKLTAVTAAVAGPKASPEPPDAEVKTTTRRRSAPPRLPATVEFLQGPLSPPAGPVCFFYTTR